MQVRGELQKSQKLKFTTIREFQFLCNWILPISSLPLISRSSLLTYTSLGLSLSSPCTHTHTHTHTHTPLQFRDPRSHSLTITKIFVRIAHSYDGYNLCSLLILIAHSLHNKM
ncbi:hypothetical protein AAZX31_03G066100 [Glycine max]